MSRHYTIPITFILFVLLAAACAPTQVAGPIRPTNTPAAAPTQAPSASPIAPATPLPSVTSQPPPTAPAPASPYQGFVVYDATPGKFTAYDFQGKPLGLVINAGEQFVGRSPNETQVVNGAIYYRGEDHTIIRADAQGSRPLANIPAEHLSTYQISPDEQLIAYAIDLWDQTPPRSELWVAHSDGSQARQIMTSTVTADGAFFTVQPYRWTDDGRLLIVQTPTGIGGYILYQAYSALHLYDPQTGEVKPLYQPTGGFRMCLSTVTFDVKYLGFGCDDAGASKVNIRTVATGQTTVVPDLPEQNVAGSLHFSPANNWLAYSIARRDPDNEYGQVAVVPVDMSSAPRIIASQAGGYYDVIGWIDENTLLIFLTRDGQGSIWRVNKDGSDLAQIATGSFVAGLMSTATQTPGAAPTPAAVLPAPLYYLAPGSSATQQIWRIEIDGATRTQITQEAADITDFDISPSNGALAYVSNNVLITTDRLGQNRSVMVEGPPLAPQRNESYYTAEITKPRWSPDGSRLAYGMNGINLIDAASGTSTPLRPNDPIPGPNDPITQTANLYWPYSWSPDGSHMLIEMGYYRSEGSMGVLNLADNSVAALSSPAGYVYCAPAWTPDSQSIVYANPTDGIVPPGMWRTNITTGAGETLINGIAKDAVLSVANAFPTSANLLYYFYAVTKAPRDPAQSVLLSMYRSQSDGVTDQTQLRTDGYVIGEALWASTASGAVIVDAPAGGYLPQGQVLYLKADGSPAIPLADVGRLLRWGK